MVRIVGSWRLIGRVHQTGIHPYIHTYPKDNNNTALALRPLSLQRGLVVMSSHHQDHVAQKEHQRLNLAYLVPNRTLPNQMSNFSESFHHQPVAEPLETTESPVEQVANMDDPLHEEILRSWMNLLEKLDDLGVKTMELEDVGLPVDRYLRKGDDLQIGRDVSTHTTKLNGIAVKAAAKFFRFPIPRRRKLAVDPSLEEDPQAVLKQAYIEVCVMKHPSFVDHPNILSLLGVSLHQDIINTVQLTLLMELADLGSLDIYLARKDNPLSWEIKTKILMDVANGLRCFHENNIVHNDVKPANILLFRSQNSHGPPILAKLADFGWTRPLPVRAPHSQQFEPAGDEDWGAPEIQKRAPLSTLRDVYSFGRVVVVIAIEPSVPVRPNDLTLGRALDALKEINGAPESITKIVEGTLQNEPQKRIAMNEVLRLLQNECSEDAVHLDNRLLPLTLP